MDKINKLSKIECSIVRLISDNHKLLTTDESISIRWALSLARITKIKLDNKDSLTIGHALEGYRNYLYEILEENQNATNIDLVKLKSVLPTINKLVSDTRKDLLSLFSSKLSPQDLDNAIKKRPLALALGGGGGTCYVFIGAFLALEENNIIPNIMAASSMGAILGAYRAQSKQFSLDGLQYLIKHVSWNMIAKSYSGASKFGVPATFRLYLREAIGENFKIGNEFLRIKDLVIPLRVCVAGLSNAGLTKEQEDFNKYSNLLASSKGDPYDINVRNSSIINQILSFAQKPLKPIYLGSSTLTKEFDVIDAIGFSSAIPGVFHYDVLRDDPRMISLLKKLFEEEKIFRLIDGGFADNLPSQQALQGVIDGECDGYDPFILAFDSFIPSINKNLLFYPIMRFAYENSKEGHEAAHLLIKFKNVLSPLNFVPSEDIFNKAIEYGHKEIQPYMNFIKNMVKEIPYPSWINKKNN